jgi:protein-disulfide isomerase/uncharacterized membrane protein
LINELHIPVTQQSIEEEIARHPSYQSMLAISELLDNWRIPNAAYKLTFEELADTEIPTPFIARFKKSFVLVTGMDKETITLYNGDSKKEQLTLAEFKNRYAGSILIAEKDEESGEADYAIKHRKEKLDKLRIPFVVTGAGFAFLAFMLLSSSYTAAFSCPLALLTLFKTAGLITAILLLVQSIDANNPLVQKLCGGNNNKDCNAILSSKAAKVTEELSWSEAGFFYFAGTWLALLLNSNNLAVVQLLAILNIISLPYTFYSIYYQWRVAKQWCIFCCTVQALLWLEFFSLLPYITQGLQTPAVTDVARVLAAMALPVLAWVFIKPYLQLSKQIDPLKQQLRQFKYNTDLFKKVLNDSVQYTLPSEEDSLIIGNREAEQVITMVSNPYCQPCAKTHKKLDEWLASRDDIKLQVVFSVSTTDESDKKTKVASHLMSLQAGRDDVSLKKALDDWYEQKQKDYDAWAKEHPMTIQTTNTETLEKQKEWCKLTEITGTPTIFINGRKLPKPYQTEDIKYFI